MDIPSYFAYELTSVPSALFKDGLVRKAHKPVLAKEMTKGLPTCELPGSLYYVVDGGALFVGLKMYLI